jgi:hypothetical protein
MRDSRQVGGRSGISGGKGIIAERDTLLQYSKYLRTLTPGIFGDILLVKLVYPLCPHHNPTMPTKRELEDSFHQYRGFCRQAVEAERHHAYSDVLQLAGHALPYLRDAIAFQRRYEKIEKPSLKAVDLLLRYAPALFDVGALDQIERWFAGANRVERKLYANLPDQIHSARAELRNGIESWPSWDSGSTTIDPLASPKLTRIWLDYGSIKLCPEEGKRSFELRPIQKELSLPNVANAKKPKKEPGSIFSMQKDVLIVERKAIFIC